MYIGGRAPAVLVICDQDPRGRAVNWNCTGHFDERRKNKNKPNININLDSSCPLLNFYSHPLKRSAGGSCEA
jgi:hypothetical protein